MTTSQLAAPSALLFGAQRPRHLWVPEYDDTAGAEAIELAESAGLVPDDWQRFVITEMLGEREDGKWSAFQVALEVARQNGKGGVYEIRELAGLFLFGEKLLIHTAHDYKTAEQALNRMEAILQGAPDLWRKVRTVKRSHGQEGIYLKTGQELRYATRTKSSGRGFTCDFLGMDEAMEISPAMHATMFPTMTARPKAQILYAGSAVDQTTMSNGGVFAGLRERGIAGGDPRLAYFGWSAPFDRPGDITDEDARDPANWAAANPAFGIRISADYVEMEQRALGSRGFAVERLGVGDWPSTDENAESIISTGTWRALADGQSRIVGPVSFAFDVTPSRDAAAICAAGLREDGLAHVEVVAHRPGTSWVPARLAELQKAHDAAGVFYGKNSPAAALAVAVETVGVEAEGLGGGDEARACGAFLDAVNDARLRHGGTDELAAAATGAGKRPVGDAFAWSRKASSVDISPLVACTLALWGASGERPSVYEERGLLTI